MTAIANAMNSLFDLLCAPFGGAAAAAVAVLSLPIGALMMLLFKLATDQDQLVAARRVLTGRVYELGLFQDHLGVLARIQQDLALANLRYLGRSLPALLAMLLPLLLILAQLDARYGHRPLRPGETTLVTARLDAGAAALLDGIALEAPAGLVVETRPVCDPRALTATWRVRVEAAGRHDLLVRLADGTTERKRLEAGSGAPRQAAWRERESLRRVLLNPAEAPLPAGQPVVSITAALPGRELDYGILRTNWLVALGVFSLAFGLAVKDLLKVRF